MPHRHGNALFIAVTKATKPFPAQEINWNWVELLRIHRWETILLDPTLTFLSLFCRGNAVSRAFIISTCTLFQNLLELIMEGIKEFILRMKEKWLTKTKWKLTNDDSLQYQSSHFLKCFFSRHYKVWKDIVLVLGSERDLKKYWSNFSWNGKIQKKV